MNYKECFLEIRDENQKSGKRKLYYTAWGNPQNQCVLCIHGVARNCRDFDYLAHHLSENFYVICPDIAGRGQSTWLDDKSFYNHLTYINDIGKLLSNIKVEEVYWVGTSMGGLIALSVANIYPKLIKKLILNDVGPYVIQKSLSKIKNYINDLPKYQDHEEAKAALKSRMKSFGITKEEHWDHITKYSFYSNDNNILEFNYDPAIIQSFGDDNIKDIELWHLWDNLDIPVMVIHGKKSDILTDDIIARMQKTKKFRYLPIENVGHVPSLMEGYEINSILQWFDARMPL